MIRYLHPRPNAPERVTNRTDHTRRCALARGPRLTLAWERFTPQYSLMRRAGILIVLLCTTACVEEAPISPYPEQIIPATIRASDRDLQPGETSTLTVSLTNTLDEEVQLTFPTSCQALVFIRNASGRVITPENGTYECAAVPSLLTMPAGFTKTYTLQWGAGIEFGPAGTSSRVPPGTYYASAELRADNYYAIAFPITIVVH